MIGCTRGQTAAGNGGNGSLNSGGGGVIGPQLAIVSVKSQSGNSVDITFNQPVTLLNTTIDGSFKVNGWTMTSVNSAIGSVVNIGFNPNVPVAGLAWQLFFQPGWLSVAVFIPESGALLS